MMLRLFASRDSRYYLIGQVFSLFGDSALWLGMGVWVKVLTGSSSSAGLVMFAFVAGQLLAPLSGMLVDRVRRRPLLIVTNVMTGLLVLSLLAVRDKDDVWIIYAVMFLYGAAASLLEAAQTALLPALLPAHLLAEANGFLQVSKQGLKLVAPIAGAGAVVTVGPHWVVIVDALSFAVAVAALARTRVDEPAPLDSADGQRGAWGQRLLAGILHIRGVPDLRRLMVASMLTMTVFGFPQTALYAIAERLHRSPDFIGVLISAQGAGAIASGLVVGKAVRRFGERGAATAGFASYALGAMLLALPSLPAVCAGVVLCGSAVPWILVSLVTMGQRLSPAHLQGRVHAAFSMLNGVPQALSIVVGAWLVSVVDLWAVMALMSTVVFVAAAYLGLRGGSQSDQESRLWKKRERTMVPPG
ncbi:MFS transporter [Streptomyces avidinii]|uniref:MFS transporter n=1 Tax=Streptomyces avidinii TaxID=1895 RepID=UPI00386FAA06|nr:MFS transporter [Streptomyces avidinii]